MKISFEDFLKQVKRDYRYSLSQTKAEEWTLEHKWYTGGVGGGSCWDEGESHHYATDGEPEPAWYKLDAILEEYAPDLKHREFNELSKFIHENYDTESEYYGNSTTYAIKTLKIKDLYDFLAERGYIEK